MTLIRVAGLPSHEWEALACGIPDWGVLEKTDQALAEALLQVFGDALEKVPASPFRTALYNARKAFYLRRKLPSEALRGEIDSTGNLSRLSDLMRRWELNQREKQAAEILFDQRLILNFEALQGLAQDNTLRRALAFASHPLLSSLSEFAHKQVDAFQKKDRQTALSLLQYVSRTCFKTSPLSHFTTLQLRNLEAHPVQEERVGDWQHSRMLVSPNVALLPAIYAVLLREPAFYRSLQLTLNPCIPAKKESKNLHATEISWLYFDGEKEAFQHIDPDPVLDMVLEIFSDRGRNIHYKELLEALVQGIAASEKELESFILRLIDIGLLEWNLPEKGLSAQWCGALYQYLGYLPSSDVLTKAAFLLQWLRTAARTAPFQSNEALLTLQKDAWNATRDFFETHGEEMPPIPPEQLFFEDVSMEVDLDYPSGTIQQLAQQLADCWVKYGTGSGSAFRRRLIAFAETHLIHGKPVGFLDFSRSFLENKDKPEPEEELPSNAWGKAGALLQVYREEGKYKAVVNALYPGGGKLFARWLSLFPEFATAPFLEWGKTQNVIPSFPWQGWSNANFQPLLSDISLSVPDGRVGHIKGGRSILLCDLSVQKNEQGLIQLIENQTGAPILLNDLGLEAPETRPPVMQILWYLGVPYVSLGALQLLQNTKWEQIGGVRFRQRVEYQSLILARAAWEMPAEVWSELFSRGKTQAERVGNGVQVLRGIGLPRRFFGQFGARREKPQYYDLESPISMVLLEKNLRKGEGAFLLTEMLPVPEQWLGDRAAEWVVEFDWERGNH